MSEIDRKIQDISKTIEQTRFKVDTSVRSTAICYIIIIVLFTVYTIWTGSKIRELATPANIAAMISSKFSERLPELKQTMIEQAKTQAPIMAANTVDMAVNAIPGLEDLAKVQIDATIESVINTAFKEMLPQLQEACKQVLDKVAENKDMVKDSNVSKAVAAELANRIDAELNKIIDNAFYTRLSEFRQEIADMAAKPEKKLTLKELAEKRVIIYWMFLVENEEIGTSPLVESLRFFDGIDLKN